uniref:Glutathione S-transferase d1 n=1 Tax=Lissorhoptrus oryzophilus TaxID=308863 RepID=A0A2R4FXE9_9CUCU|nr:glutathione S-transferase d1 [Lissorhoptrus oryzophilus]
MMTPNDHSIEVYYFKFSPPSRSALLLAKALGLKPNIIITNMTAGDHMKPEFLKMNPMHTIPVIKDNGFTLYDSQAIMIYLVNQYGKDDSLYPRDPKKAAIVNLRLFFNASYLSPKFNAHHAAIILGRNPPDDAQKNLEDVLQHLNNFLETSPFVAGQNITIADFSIIGVISTIDACGAIDLSAYPNIWKWYQKAQKAMEGFGYEEVMQDGANAYGEAFKNAIAKL